MGFSMNPNPEICFDVLSGELILRKDKKTYRRNLNSDEVVGLMGTAAKFETSLLPRGTRFFSSNANRIGLIIAFPGTIRNVKVAPSSVVKDVPLPAGIFIANIQRTPTGYFSLYSCALFAVNNANFSSFQEPVFRFPTPNVKIDGTVCWSGTVKDFGFPKLAGVEGFLQTFMETYFNHHLTEDGMLNEKFDWASIGHDYKGTFKYFGKLAQAGAFNNDWLKPSSVNTQTIEGAMKVWLREFV